MRRSAQQALLLLACGLPALVAGLAEDLTKNVSPSRRLLATALSALLAVWLLDAAIRRTAIPGLDWVVSFPVGRGAGDGVRGGRRGQFDQHHRRLQRPGVDVRAC